MEKNNAVEQPSNIRLSSVNIRNYRKKITKAKHATCKHFSAYVPESHLQLKPQNTALCLAWLVRSHSSVKYSKFWLLKD